MAARIIPAARISYGIGGGIVARNVAKTTVPEAKTVASGLIEARRIYRDRGRADTHLRRQQEVGENLAAVFCLGLAVGLVSQCAYGRRGRDPQQPEANRASIDRRLKLAYGEAQVAGRTGISEGRVS